MSLGHIENFTCIVFFHLPCRNHYGGIIILSFQFHMEILLQPNLQNSRPDISNYLLSFSVWMCNRHLKLKIIQKLAPDILPLIALLPTNSHPFGIPHPRQWQLSPLGCTD